MLCGKGSLISLILALFKTKALANSLRGLAFTQKTGTRKDSCSPLTPPFQKTGRRKDSCSPLTPPFLHVCQPFPQAASQQQDITTNTRARRGKLRRRNHACLLPLWKQFPLRTGSGLGRLAEQSC
jgi:hypothetical protein